MPGPEDIRTSDEGARARNLKWMIALAAVVLVVVIAALFFVLRVSAPSAEDDGGSAGAETTRTSQGAVPASDEESATGGEDGGDGAQPNSDDEGGEDGTPDGDGEVVLGPSKVAYRKGGFVWVADDDGAGPQRLVRCEAWYALSPDGKHLAYIPGGGDLTLRLYEVATGEDEAIGDASPFAPAWTADSRMFAFTSISGAVAVSDLSGDVVDTGLQGFGAHFSRSGVLGFMRSSSPSAEEPEWRAFRMGSSALWEGDAEFAVSDFALGDGVLYVASQAVPGKGTTIYKVDLPASPADFDLEGDVLVGPPHGVGFMIGYTSLLLSPDGEYLAYAAAGDDGFSRMYVVPTSGGQPTELSIRRDAYPLQWSEDGEYLLFIEGNAFQGEDTRLMRVRPDGTGRQVLIEGAGL